MVLGVRKPRQADLQRDDLGRAIPARGHVTRELTLGRRECGERSIGVQTRQCVGLDDLRTGLGEGGGLEELLGVVAFGGSDATRETEVDEPDLALLVHEDVRRLDVAVHDVCALR